MKKPPCLYCKQRSTGCHSSCKIYKAWKDDRERAREAEKKAKHLESEIYFAQHKTKRRNKPW